VRLSALGILGLVISAGLPPGAAGASSGESRRIDVVFVIDNSGSMKQNDPGFIMRRVVRDFVYELPAGSRLGMVLFAEAALLIEPLGHPAGADPAARIARSLERVDYAGRFTNSPAAVERALYELRSHGRDGADKVIVLLTDGLVDTGDRTRDAEKKRWLLEDLAAESRREGVRIFGIAFTDRADYELIQALATRTEGDYFRVYAAEDIPAVLAEVGARLARPAIAPVAAAAPPARAASARGRDRSAGLLLALGASVLLAALGVPLLLRRRAAGAGQEAPAPRGRRGAAVRAMSARSRASDARLVDVGRVTASASVSLGGERHRVGRNPSNDIVIPDDTVSSFHATLEQRDGYFHLEDHRSTNGTFLNGRRLRENQPVPLKSGDRIDFAHFEFRFLVPTLEPSGRTVVIETPSPLGEAAGAAAGGERRPDPEAAFRSGLEAQIQRIRFVGPDHAAFVDRSFTPDLMAALCGKVRELVQRTAVDGRGHSGGFVRRGTFHTLCVLPVTPADAPAWFGREYGGYARFLAHLLDSHFFKDRGCETLCVIGFGSVSPPWVSLSVLPAKRDPAAIEVMSFELLSEEERRLALALELEEVIRASGRDACSV